MKKAETSTHRQLKLSHEEIEMIVVTMGDAYGRLISTYRDLKQQIPQDSKILAPLWNYMNKLDDLRAKIQSGEADI